MHGGYIYTWEDKQGAHQMVSQAKQKREPAVKTYEPVFDKLVVAIIPPEEKEGMIHLPERSQKDFQTVRARVLAKGPDCKSAVMVDDVVLLPGSQYECVIHRGQQTLVVAENQIWGIEIAE